MLHCIFTKYRSNYFYFLLVHHTIQLLNRRKIRQGHHLKRTLSFYYSQSSSFLFSQFFKLVNIQIFQFFMNDIDDSIRVTFFEGYFEGHISLYTVMVTTNKIIKLLDLSGRRKNL